MDENSLIKVSVTWTNIHNKEYYADKFDKTGLEMMYKFCKEYSKKFGDGGHIVDLDFLEKEEGKSCAIKNIKWAYVKK